MITRLKWALVSAVLVVGLIGGVAMSQSKEGKADLAMSKEGVITKVDDKKLPPEVSIPETRVDKTKILTLELRVISSDIAALEAKYKELKASQDEKQAKLFAEFSSALKAAGVAEENLNKYQVNLETLKLTLREEPKAEVKKP